MDVKMPTTGGKIEDHGRPQVSKQLIHSHTESQTDISVELIIMRSLLSATPKKIIENYVVQIV